MKTEPELRDQHNVDEEPKAHEAILEQRTQRRIAPLLLVGFIAWLAYVGGWSLLVFVFAIIVMITLHELGHYLTAKWSGMKVTEYFLGFGPRLWSFRKGETEYGVKLIPAGAYVRIIGMHNLDEAPPEDEPRTFRQQSYPKKVLVASAGSAMHFLLALLCIFMALAVTGVPGGKLFTDNDAWQIEEVSEGTAAQQAGLQPGDRIVAVDGQQLGSFEAFHDYVAPRPNEAVTITVLRDGREMQVPATLGERDGHGLLGVTRGLPANERVSPVRAAGHTFVEVGYVTRESLGFLGKFFTPSGISNFADQVASAGDERADQASEGNSAPPPSSSSSSSSSDAPDETRPMSIIGVASVGSDLTREGLMEFLAIFALLNIFIGLFNLLPLLPLDGGHIAVATYERIRSRKGRRYEVDMAKLLPITYAVVVVLAFIGLSTMYLDVVNPVN